MSHEIEGTKRVRDTLDFTLKSVLDGFVEANMKAKHGQRWLHYASRSSGQGQNDPLDVYGLCKTILDNWNEVFSARFDRKHVNKARRLVSTVFEARNATAHLNVPLSDPEALSFLWAIVELAMLLKAPEKTIEALKTVYGAQRSTGIEAGKIDPATPAEPKLTAEPVSTQQLSFNSENGPAKALKPWIDVALPHPDVIANRFKEAEFAADLFAVDAGYAGEGYATPNSFYGITFLTEGLKRVLTTATQRLGGSGGDPVIGLQTAFGGGKTHTMLAIFHLVKHLRDGGDPRGLPGLSDILDRADVKSLPKPKMAVFVGSADGPDVSLKLNDGPRVHTAWGYIAWRLAGDPGLALVAEAEAARTSPGSRIMVEVFKLAGPSVILLDELTMFARQLDDDRFEAFLSFIQSLTEAAKMVPGILIVGSLVESKAEAGGPRGEAALLRLEKIFGRVQSAWLPASGDETYEIIRRRLFQPLDTEGEKARDETVKAFHDLYKKNPAEFPPEAREARYLELLRLSYPIHPELFDRLSKDWASLEKFQRTRGVLRFMANVVGVLWHGQMRDPLITPARVPVAHERVRVSVLYPLDPAFGAVVDKEVDGEGSLPNRMEANPSRRISQLRAATRAARSVFICTAPLVGQPNAGLTGQGLRVACAEPGDQLAIFGEALRELTEKATYLYEEAGRYWFSTQPTLNRLADDRAQALPDHEVDAAIADVLREDAGSKGGFHRIFAAPDDPVTIDEAHSLSLVILSPALVHAGRGAVKSPASDAVADALMRCRASQRRLRNTLVFVAPDEANLATAREVMRKAMAWASIDHDVNNEKGRLRSQTTRTQADDAKDKAKTNRESALKATRTAWSHILYPVKSETAGKPFDLEHSLISSRDRAAIPHVVYDKAKADGIVLEKLGTDRLWLALKPIWPEDRPHLSIAEIADWFAAFVYLPKVRDKVVLEGSIRDAVAKLDPQFGYADGFDEATGKYHRLIWAKNPPEFASPTAMIVREAEAQKQLSEEGAAVPRPESGSSPSPVPHPGMSEPSVTEPSAPSKPRRFYGSVEIDMVRPVKSFDAILNAVVMELQRTNGAKVKLTLEIEAEASDGFAEGEVSVVRDNARQLKFKSESTGFED
ncbi:DUF499 domain-containing protein [Mesorhizobium australicum]|uniref:DUF499 domain-containing protein n=1 Tax=Mesorhizobium australicum TaxID=536018 RepID=UPI0033361B30